MDLEMEIVSAEIGKLQIVTGQRRESRDAGKFQIFNEVPTSPPKYYDQRHLSDRTNI